MYVCMCVCMYVCIYLSISIYLYIYIYIYTNIYNIYIICVYTKMTLPCPNYIYFIVTKMPQGSVKHHVYVQIVLWVLLMECASAICLVMGRSLEDGNYLARQRFINGVWVHNWNVKKYMFALISISINQSGHTERMNMTRQITCRYMWKNGIWSNNNFSRKSNPCVCKILNISPQTVCKMRAFNTTQTAKLCYG